MPQSPESASASTAEMTQLTGEVVITKEDDSIEIEVSSSKLATPRLYAFALTDALEGFFASLAADLGEAKVELSSPSGATISPLTAHQFAWKPGRWIAAGGGRLEVRLMPTGEALPAGPSAGPAKTRAGLGGSMRYVVVSGGVVSGLGKGVTASSLSVLMKASGYRVTSIKIDPYLNIDAGTMSPFEHGEVFVLDDGGEADLDLGNYERFNGITLTRAPPPRNSARNSLTAGAIRRAIR